MQSWGPEAPHRTIEKTIKEPSNEQTNKESINQTIAQSIKQTITKGINQSNDSASLTSPPDPPSRGPGGGGAGSRVFLRPSNFEFFHRKINYRTFLGPVTHRRFVGIQHDFGIPSSLVEIFSFSKKIYRGQNDHFCTVFHGSRVKTSILDFKPLLFYALATGAKA